MARLLDFCDFIASPVNAHLKPLIKEVTLPILEPWITGHVVGGNGYDHCDPILATCKFWIPEAWDVSRIERLLASLNQVRILNVGTFRPAVTQHFPPEEEELIAHELDMEPAYLRSLETVLESGDLIAVGSIPTIGLPDHITVLNLLESFEVLIDIFPYLSATCNLRLFRPTEAILRLSHSSCIPFAENSLTNGGGGWGLDGISAYSSIRDLRIHVGEHGSPFTLDEDRLMPQLRSLPHLHTFELRLCPYSSSVTLPTNWPALLPSLKVFRTPIRSFPGFAATTTAENDVSFEVLVSEHEMADPQHWKDREYVTTFLVLAEEMAHYISTHQGDNRSLRLEAINVSIPDYSWWENADETRRRELRELDSVPCHDELYYPLADQHSNIMGWQADHDLSLYCYYNLPKLIATMPGFGSEREQYPLVADDDENAIKGKMIKWAPRGNLGINWPRGPDGRLKRWIEDEGEELDSLLKTSKNWGEVDP